MLQYAPVPAKKVYSKIYNAFRGVDMSSGVTEVDDSRSPQAPNMISDLSGFPEKRPGYKSILATLFPGKVWGIHQFAGSAGDKMIVHTGTNLYALPVSDNIGDASKVLIYSGLSAAPSTAFMMAGKLYLMDGANYVYYDGTTAANVETIATVPTTRIAVPPAGGGTKYQPVNMLQPKRINKYQGTAGDTVYYLDTDNIASVNLVEKLSGSTWTNITSTISSVDLVAGKITFSTAPGATTGGIDNLRITYTKTISGYADRIKNCTIAAFYGLNSDNRIFVSGNPGWKNYDWTCYINDPTYFPDDGYSVVGTDNTAIMGYLKQYDSLVIVKEDSDTDATMYLRTASVATNGTDILYRLQQGLAGVGAIAKRAFAVLRDDPLFVSRLGVFGTVSNEVTREHTAQLRSYYINSPLAKEPGLAQAIGVVWGRYYILFVNNKAYVADSQQTNQNGMGSFGYEWYYWDSIPASAAKVINGSLYFGTDDGDMCKFTTYEEYGMSAYWDRGEAYNCLWSTKMDTLGNFMQCKTVLKHGVGVIAKPYVKTSGVISFANEDEIKKYAAEFSANLGTFDFAALDFTSLSFNPVTNPRIIPINHKLKNTKLLQVIVENSTGGTGFGIFGVQIRYQFTKDVKK